MELFIARWFVASLGWDLGPVGYTYFEDLDLLTVMVDEHQVGLRGRKSSLRHVPGRASVLDLGRFHLPLTAFLAYLEHLARIPSCERGDPT